MPQTPDRQVAIRVGCIGVGGQGHFDMREVGRHAQVAAICDIDAAALAEAARLFPEARTFSDHRELIEDGSLDAVTISVPDHQHAPIALRALAAGLHCHCQKPMATSIADVHEMSRAAAGSGRRTQVSLDGLAHARAWQAIEAIQAGALGEVEEVHAWTDRPGPHWDPLAEPDPTPAPDGFDWEGWLGSSDYEGAYRPWTLPRQWRGWRAFGTGALGDLGTHNCALAFAALGVRGAPLAVEGEWGRAPSDRFPPWSQLRFELRTESGGALTMHWYDGGRQPPVDLFEDVRRDGNGCLIVGTRGRCYLPGSMNEYVYFLPRRRFADLRLPPPREVPGVVADWLRACATGGATALPFDGVAAAIAEAMLAGNRATESARAR